MGRTTSIKLNYIALCVVVFFMTGAPLFGAQAQAGENASSSVMFCYDNPKASALRNNKLSFEAYQLRATSNDAEVKPYLAVWKKLFMQKNSMSEAYFKEHILYPAYVQKSTETVGKDQYLVLRFFMEAKISDYYLAEIHPKLTNMSLMVGAGDVKHNVFINANELWIKKVKNKALSPATVFERYSAKYITKKLKINTPGYTDVFINIADIRINNAIPTVLAGCNKTVEAVLACTGIQYAHVLSYDARANKISLYGAGESADQCYTANADLVTGKVTCGGPNTCNNIGL